MGTVWRARHTALERDDREAQVASLNRAGDRRVGAFIMLAPAAQEARPDGKPQMVLVQHWDQELRRLVPGD